MPFFPEIYQLACNGTWSGYLRCKNLCMAVPVFFGQQPAVFITAHKVTGGWNPGSTTWNNQPAYQSNVLDYCSVKAGTVR